MAPASVIFRITCSLTVFVISLNHAECKFPSVFNNTTDYASSLTGRSKRSLYDDSPVTLMMRIKYRTEESIMMSFMKVPEHLANKYLNVLTAHIGLHNNVMSEVGDFVLYQDHSKCSAIVYFGNFNTLYGVIGMDYYLQDLPFNFDTRGVHKSEQISEPFLRKRESLPNHIHPGMIYPPPSDTEAWIDFLTQGPRDSDQSPKRQLVCESSTSNKHQHTENSFRARVDGNADVAMHHASTSRQLYQHPRYKHYFLEILVFVTRDIVELLYELECCVIPKSKGFFGEEQYIGWIVRYLIIYFNAVDMMFAKIKSLHATVHMNLAKIVIENEHIPFNFMKNGDLQFSEIVEMLPQYLNSQAQSYPRDSFDHIFIYTSRPIYDDIVEVNGLSKYGKDLYEARKKNQFYEVVPITIVRFQYYYADYPVTVHEIGRIFDMKIESRREGLGPAGQCVGVMQRGGPKCRKCLKWSTGSRNQFGQYLRTNRNRCFLLNEPRSLHPPIIRKMLTPQEQCKCFGYKSYMTYPSGIFKTAVGSDGCDMPLKCVKNDGSQHITEFTVFPFDGTHCTSYKICWEKQCEYPTANRPRFGNYFNPQI